MTHHPGRPRRAVALASALVPVLLAGCASTSRRDAVPEGLETSATLAGFPSGMRYFPRDAEDVREFERDYRDSLEREKSWRRSRGETGALPAAAFLAISGGGDNGAFGAGLLNGWTKAGTRPEFRLVTGVSTGALIAPFAFLGPDHDATLRALYTGISLRDVAEKRWLFSALFGDAMADNAPLRRLVETYVTPELLEAIAREHEKGRVLLVATTDLDARRPVIWNLTKIAASRSPRAPDLVRKILVASAAIPGTFPPTMIEVEAGGRTFEEMHVDGGTAAQVFVYPAAVRIRELSDRERTLYIIRNARLDPEWAQVERRTLPIALRAITCLVQYQGIGDLYRIYAVTQRDRVAFRLAYIPPTFNTPHREEFDTAYMTALFELGERRAAAGTPWEDRPPVLLSGESDEPAGPR